MHELAKTDTTALRRAAISAALAVGVLLSTVLLLSPQAHASASTDRLQGADRFATAVAVSRELHPAGADAVVLATGRNWPDALGGAALAGAVDGPVLLAEQNQIPPAALAEIGRLNPEIVYVLGGDGALGDEIEAGIASVAPLAQVRRVFGASRYGTATQVASETVSALGSAWDGHAFVATGLGFADALASGPLCVSAQDPIYLLYDGLRTDAILAAMVDAGVTDVTILGGTGAISTALQARVANALGSSGTVDRVAGADRYATAVAIAEYGSKNTGMSWSAPGAASGMGFADAVTAGPLLGSRGAPLLLTRPAELPDNVAEALHAHGRTTTELTIFGGSGAISQPCAQELEHALVAPPFSQTRAMAHVTHLTGLGPRGAGGTAEHAAFDYIAGQLRSFGYDVTVQNLPIPNGWTHNVIAEKRGTEPGVLVLGGHVDSKPPSPGGNDNASGVGVTLELARVLATAPTAPTVRFIAFGAEEISGPTAADHHFGSRHYVATLSSAQRSAIQGMISIDMVGYGNTFNVRHMGVGTFSLIWSLQARGGFVGQPIPYLRDPGRSGWSDHEAFEFAGIPAAWLEWRNDPDYHTVRDTAAHVQADKVRTTGRVVRGWVLEMTAEELAALR